ncbi:hypothetical protein TNIN_401211 [Trichonephila inaurata madagascariensis]|uniref:Uncharacterized protein n=1 Tax=Trichonephila inaurata madagascariensis TaxID=2747483 RepID=A0A8X7BPF9_9ARAC|nr:hypothetical protein TNIN_401211 [Trichonephila inaurata madagascariensis]
MEKNIETSSIWYRRAIVWRCQRNKYNSEISKKPTLRQKNPDRDAALSYLSPFQLTSSFNSLCMRDLQECCLIWLLGSICISYTKFYSTLFIL